MKAGDGLVLEPLNGSRVELKRNMGLFSGCAMILGTIIGSGIFVSPKGVLEVTGSVGLALLVWALCGLLVLLGALCYAELGTMIPKSGGAYAYILQTFGNLPAFLYMWSISFVVIPTGNAIIALTFAQYTLKPFFNNCESPQSARLLLATLAIALLSGINAFSVSLATKIQGIFTVIKLFALAIIILTGVIVLFQGQTEHFHNSWENSISNPGAIAIAFYSGLFSYAGWDSLNFLVEELKNPYENLPRAIMISLPAVSIIYVLANISYFAVLGPAEILASDAVAVSFATLKYGVMAWVMPILVAFSTFGSLNGCIMCIGRLFFVGAREGHLPEALALINMKRFTPIPAILVLCFISIGMLFMGDIYTLINYCSLVEAFGFGLCAMVLLYLRWKEPMAKRPIKVPILIPIVFLGVCLFLLLFPLYSNPHETLMGFYLLLSGLPVYFIGVAWKTKLTRFLQKLTYSCEQDK